MTIIHDPGNDRVIDTLYVFMSTDKEGRHGILADVIPGVLATPLVTGSETLAKGVFAPLARRIGAATGKKVSMFEFTRGKEFSLDP